MEENDELPYGDEAISEWKPADFMRLAEMVQQSTTKTDMLADDFQRKTEQTAVALSIADFDGGRSSSFTLRYSGLRITLPRRVAALSASVSRGG